MSLRPLHLLGSPVLRERAREVGTPTAATAAFVADLFDTMRKADGVGLAANQVGVAERVALVDTHDGEPIVLIDPVIVERYGRERGEEGCLSIPDLFGEKPVFVVGRYDKGGNDTVTVKGRLAGRPFAQRVNVTLPDAPTGPSAPDSPRQEWEWRTGRRVVACHGSGCPSPSSR